MKRIMLRLVSFLCVLALLFSVVSCKEEEENGDTTKYHSYGLHFELPKEYRKITVSYSENCYYNNEAFFYFVLFTGDEIVELGYAADISVKNYTVKFLLLQDLPLDIYIYDEEKDRSFIKYVHEYETDSGMENELFYHVIFRGSNHLYIVTMTCPATLREKYEPSFDELANNIYPD